MDIGVTSKVSCSLLVLVARARSSADWLCNTDVINANWSDSSGGGGSGGFFERERERERGDL